MRKLRETKLPYKKDTKRRKLLQENESVHGMGIGRHGAGSCETEKLARDLEKLETLTPSTNSVFC